MYKWLKRLFGMGTYESTKGRTYHFPLPYKLSPSNLKYAITLLKWKGVWNNIPKDLRLKMEHNNKKWYPLRITERDLNRLDDKTWKIVAKKLSLKWSA